MNIQNEVNFKPESKYLPILNTLSPFACVEGHYKKVVYISSMWT